MKKRTPQIILLGDKKARLARIKARHRVMLRGGPGLRGLSAEDHQDTPTRRVEPAPVEVCTAGALVTVGLE